MTDYRIEAHEITVPQTDEWNPRPVQGTVYRVVGPGVDRPATDIEIAVWKQGNEEAQRLRTELVVARLRIDDLVLHESLNDES